MTAHAQRRSPRLVLRRETLRQLSDRELRLVNGGTDPADYPLTEDDGPANTVNTGTKDPTDGPTGTMGSSECPEATQL